MVGRPSSSNLANTCSLQDNRVDRIQWRELVFIFNSFEVTHLRNVDASTAPVIFCTRMSVNRSNGDEHGQTYQHQD